MCNIARNYLVEHLLPPEFWFFAIKYAVQVTNYIPIKTDKTTLTTPYFLAYNQKPDYQNLLPLFSAAYVKIYKSGEGNTLESQTVKAILVGNDDKSDGKLFYNPETKKLMASSDYRLNITAPSGPLFNLKYRDPTTYTLYNDSIQSDAPNFDIGQITYLSPTHLAHPGAAVTIVDIPFQHNAPYTVQVNSTKTILQVMHFDILPYNPQTSESDGQSPLLHHPWFKHNAKVTLFQPDQMSEPKHGILVLNGTTYNFHQGHSLTSKSKTKKKPIITLPTEIPDIERLVETSHLCKGWQNSKTVLTQINNAKTFNFVARRVTFMNSSDPSALTGDSIRDKLDKIQQPEIIGYTNKVSAANLSSTYEPKLHEHHKLNENDKEIWDRSYLEEYMGLHDETGTWEYITEEQYQSLKPIVGNALPTMAISKVKTDKNGAPTRAKY